ncbi:MAG TPA: regulatory iron-sulfur-containing complex subunit RicT [Candidatus Nanopelagicaceae bacterium]|nr:regulatory iron-sulfur-containing complex subunit RicT [Candidatus Nanopelagicaceae bacterium]
MTLAVGVKFRHHGPLNYYDPVREDLIPGSRVLADTSRGVEIGEVVMAAADIEPAMLPRPLPPILRRATDEDLAQRRDLDGRLPEAMRVARELVEERKLPLKIARAEISFDGTRILFDLTAERQTQYQDLARDLAGRLRCRVELRQIGARDEAKIQDGYGPCGQRLCCSSWLKEFVPVTIKMAKEQGLPLNPTRLNGMCGKLKCCLQYENEQYVDLKRHLPKPGTALTVEGGTATVTEISLVREQVLVTMTESGTVVALPVDQLIQEPSPEDLSARRRSRRPRAGQGAERGAGE